MADEEKQLKAGHPPAVKAGGMRIVQHKVQNNERPAKDVEDCTGLTTKPFIYPWQPPVNITPSVSTVSGAPIKGNVDYSPQAVQVAHSPPPPNPVPIKPVIHIQQPRK